MAAHTMVHPPTQLLAVRCSMSVGPQEYNDDVDDGDVKRTPLTLLDILPKLTGQAIVLDGKVGCRSLRAFITSNSNELKFRPRLWYWNPKGKYGTCCMILGCMGQKGIWLFHIDLDLLVRSSTGWSGGE